MNDSAQPHRSWKATGFALAGGILLADQISKWLILDLFQDAGQRFFEITPFFNIVLAWNTGVSFGMFGDVGAYSVEILIGLTLLITVVLAVWLLRATTRYTALGLGAIIGGAVGNVIDRFRFGAVTDFLDVHVLGYHWPAFNVADSAIVIGAIVLVWESLFVGTESPTTENQQDD